METKKGNIVHTKVKAFAKRSFRTLAPLLSSAMMLGCFDFNVVYKNYRECIAPDDNNNIVFVKVDETFSLYLSEGSKFYSGNKKYDVHLDDEGNVVFVGENGESIILQPNETDNVNGTFVKWEDYEVNAEAYERRALIKINGEKYIARENSRVEGFDVTAIYYWEKRGPMLVLSFDNGSEKEGFAIGVGESTKINDKNVELLGISDDIFNSIGDEDICNPVDVILTLNVDDINFIVFEGNSLEVDNLNISLKLGYVDSYGNKAALLNVNGKDYILFNEDEVKVGGHKLSITNVLLAPQ